MTLKASEVVQKIDDGYAAKTEGKARQYIGASGIGNPCDAYQDFSLRGFPNTEPSPQLKRIFRLGHILEDEVVKDLKERADVRVWEVDGLTGKQYSYGAWNGHVSAHMDGHIELDDGVLRVLEIKSMNDANFKKFKRDGVKASKPIYFAQLQMMMGLSKIESSFFIAVNKNNSQYHAEIVDFDEFEFSHLKMRVQKVLNGKATKISTDETDWRCRGCFKADVCWGRAEVKKECQTCAFAKPKPDGWWHCVKHDVDAPGICDDYELYKPLPKE